MIIDINNQDFDLKNNLDLERILIIIFRKKKIIGKFLIVGIILGMLSIISQKKIWSGRFQIVLSDKSQQISQTDLLPSSVQSLISNRSNDKIRTEVGILKSPSVLMSVFDFMIEKKRKSNNSYDQRFDNWLNNNLKINLQKGTSILEIEYLDNQKELILPILNNIAQEYKKYSGKENRQTLNEMSIYIKNKLEDYETESNNAIKALKEFETKYDLRIQSLGEKGIKTSVEQAIDFYTSRILRIDEDLDLIEELLKSNNFDEMQSFLRIVVLPTNIDRSFIDLAENIESTIFSRRQYFKENDPIIKDSIKQRKLVLRESILKTKEILLAYRKKAEAIIQSAERPDGVVSKYRTLILDSQNKNKAYAQLQKQRVTFDLLASKVERPWELITKPTQTPYPIKPQKKKTIALFSIISILSGMFYALYLDKKEGNIFNEEDLKSIFPYDFLYSFKTELINEWEEYVKIIFNKKFDNLSKSENILIFDNTKNFNKEVLKLLEIINKINKFSAFYSQNLKDVATKDNMIIVFELNQLKLKDIQKIQEFVNLTGIKVSGWIAVSNNKNKEKLIIKEIIIKAKDNFLGKLKKLKKLFIRLRIKDD